MSKLYFITGNTGEIQDKVYHKILQWSQTEQSSPLQPWPVPEEQTVKEDQAAPNLYLYDYLGKGDRQALRQLTERYGENTVEAVYLQEEGETEGSLLAAGIYKSYDPKNFPVCLKEIVETVFNGYRSTSYDFTAEKPEQENETADLQEICENPEKTPEQSAKRKRFRNRLLLCLAILVWTAAVCVITSAIYGAVNNRQVHHGHLIQVTAPPGATEMPAGQEQNAFFLEEPASYSDLDIFYGADDHICIAYGDGSLLSIPENSISYQNYQKSSDRQIAVLLTEKGNLWQIGPIGARLVEQGVSQFALSRDGTYLPR